MEVIFIGDLITIIAVNKAESKMILSFIESFYSKNILGILHLDVEVLLFANSFVFKDKAVYNDIVEVYSVLSQLIENGIMFISICEYVFIIAFFAVKSVIACTTVNGIVTFAARDVVLATISIQHIGILITIDMIVA